MLQQLKQPYPLPQSASTASPKQDPSYNFLVDSGMPQSLPRSPFVAGGFWAVILNRPVRARCWALVWSSFKACGCERGLHLNRWYGEGPACDSLDHRVGVCYLPCSLCTINFVMPLVYTHSQFPPPHFERALHLVNQGFHHS